MLTIRNLPREPSAYIAARRRLLEELSTFSKFKLLVAGDIQKRRKGVTVLD